MAGGAVTARDGRATAGRDGDGGADTPPTATGGRPSQAATATMSAAHTSASDLEAVLLHAQHRAAVGTAFQVAATAAAAAPRVLTPPGQTAAAATPAGHGSDTMMADPPAGDGNNAEQPQQEDEDGEDALAGELLSNMHDVSARRAAAQQRGDEEGDEDPEGGGGGRGGEFDGDEDLETIATGRAHVTGMHRRRSIPGGGAAKHDGGSETITVAQDGGFVIVTRGGRTLHHRPQCQCKPCMARRRALDEGTAVVVANAHGCDAPGGFMPPGVWQQAPPRSSDGWQQAACETAPQAVKPPAPGGPLAAVHPSHPVQFPSAGAGPGRGNKLCNGCGAVVRNGLRECPHCAFAFLPTRPRDDGDFPIAPSALPAFGPPQRKRAPPASVDGDGNTSARGAKEPRRGGGDGTSMPPASWWPTHTGGGGGMPALSPGGGGTAHVQHGAWGGHAARRSTGHPGLQHGAGAGPDVHAQHQGPITFAAPSIGPLELWVRLAGPGADPDFEVIRWPGPRTLRSLEAACREAIASDIPMGHVIKHLRWLDNDLRGPGRGATKIRSDTDVMCLRVQDRIEVVLQSAAAAAAAVPVHEAQHLQGNANTPPLSEEGSGARAETAALS